MYRVKVRATFSAAHRVKNEGGQCEDLHGHNWQVEVIVGASRLDKTGMVLNFRKLKEKLDKILKKWDHKYLNDLSDFKKINPTSENLARLILRKIRAGVNSRRIKVEEVVVGESDTSEASYREKD